MAPLRTTMATASETGPVRAVTEASVRQAAALLSAGELVAFPTETVYGLGADARAEAAVAKIYRVKGRPANNPLIVHLASAAAAQAVAAAWPAAAALLAGRFWPGPLTLVVPRGDLIAASVAAGGDSVALRVPAHPVALRLLSVCGLPVAAPSANRSEQISPTLAEHVRRGLPEVPLILDGGPCRLGIESTVVDVTREPARLLRPGALPLSALRAVLGEVAIGAAATDLGRSPGLMRRHYAPRARLSLVAEGDEIDFAGLGLLDGPAGLAQAEATSLGLLLCRPVAAPAGAVVERLPDDPAGYGADLYAALHRLDDAGVTHIVAQLPERGEAWLAICDRLRRAAA